MIYDHPNYNTQAEEPFWSVLFSLQKQGRTKNTVYASDLHTITSTVMTLDD